ncbi:FusB/FusC family EF-G-binding protein [Cytobacillus solani]|uniref:Ferrous iron transporter A n=1 Tax=Cytobacillus solani TaxID=1637975 RepID=A0A0Q3T358_9BACI|nr:elongation factor G-binding protein [Cytobacillus solani]KOP71187.1 ferrous iron transporter A [Bacillus sp. FJAT-21945]KQL17869.1 ferrous iron transporter A [Cytobacillus solani]USK55687.1 elongation factor G-binding protein [Cytobacillus solani]
MEPFIRSDQYNYIKNQIQILINGYTTVNDKGVLNALKTLTDEKIIHLFDDLSGEQRQIFNPIVEIRERDQAEVFLSQLKQYVIPFKDITEHSIKKLFPKAKKLKVPSLDQIDRYEISYLGWNDTGSNKKYIVAEQNDKLVGLHGSFKNVSKKGICTICHGHEELGMFIMEMRGSEQGTYIKRGNYICQDSQKCNQNIKSLDRLADFINGMKG